MTRYMNRIEEIRQSKHLPVFISLFVYSDKIDPYRLCINNQVLPHQALEKTILSE